MNVLSFVALKIRHHTIQSASANSFGFSTSSLSASIFYTQAMLCSLQLNYYFQAFMVFKNFRQSVNDFVKF